MNKLLRFLTWTFVIFGLLSLVISFTLLFSNKEIFTIGGKFDIEIGNQFGGFIAGLVGIFFSGTGTFLVFLTFEQQRDQFKISQFENSFFNLIAHLHTIIEQLSGPVRYKNIQDGNVQGRKFLYYQIRELKDMIENKGLSQLIEEDERYRPLLAHFAAYGSTTFSASEPLDLILLKSFIQDTYEDFYKSRHSFLGHYFRFVYHLIKFVNESTLDTGNKQKYIDLIQAQMSSDELGLLMINGLGQIGNKKAFPLLEQYDFLSNLDPRVLPFPDLILKLYPRTTFKNLKYGS